MSAIKKVVTIGGGNGQSCALRALRNFLPKVEITSVVSVADSGGSSGRLREEFKILPMGDLLRAILALSSYNYIELREIFYSNRFSLDGLEGHNAGNFLLTFLYQYSHDWRIAINSLGEALRIQGRVLPATLELTNLCAELADGRIIKSEDELGALRNDCRIKKNRVWLDPTGKILPEVGEAILAADFVILGPGDLYTSIIPAVLVDGMAEALLKTRAPLIYIINNANREGGETCGFNTGDYIGEMQKYLPRPMDWLIVQDPAVAPNLAHFALKKWEPVVVDDGEWRQKYQVIFSDLHDKTAAGIDWEQLVGPLGKIMGL